MTIRTACFRDRQAHLGAGDGSQVRASFIPAPGSGAKAIQMTEMYRAGRPVAEIARFFGVQNPAIWKALRRTGFLPPYSKQVNGGNGRPRQREKAVVAVERPDALIVVERDPCFWCGTRMDVGCVHFPKTFTAGV